MPYEYPTQDYDIFDYPLEEDYVSDLPQKGVADDDETEILVMYPSPVASNLWPDNQLGLSSSASPMPTELASCNKESKT